MRIYVEAKVLAVEQERDTVVYGKNKTKFAMIILQTLDGETLCTRCYGRDRVAICKEKFQTEEYAEFVLTIVGRKVCGEGYDTPLYTNEVHIKWIL